MGIPYARQYTATIEGSVEKHVKCSKCGGEFVYEMTRKGIGRGTSLLFINMQGAADRAEDRAESSLAKQLKNEHDPVPCPCCGWYQKAMIPFAKRQLHRWMMYVGLGLLPVSVISWAVAYYGPNSRPPLAPSDARLAWILTVLTFVGCVGLIGGREIWALFYNPNQQNRKKRIARGKRMARVLVEGVSPAGAKAAKKRR